MYLYGDDCLGEFRDDVPLYYLPDAESYVRQSVDADGDVVSVWLFDPDGTLLEGPDGPVSHLVCGGVYDWSTGLLYQGGRYFDPMLGIWLALLPLAVIQGRKKKRKSGHPWVGLVCVGLFAVGSLAGCDGTSTPMPGSGRTTCQPVSAGSGVHVGGKVRVGVAVGCSVGVGVNVGSSVGALHPSVISSPISTNTQSRCLIITIITPGIL